MLLADDEPFARMLLVATFEGDPRYKVLVAKDGQEALDMARQYAPDLIFLDVNMPKMDGIEVCAQARPQNQARQGVHDQRHGPGLVQGRCQGQRRQRLHLQALQPERRARQS